MAGNAVLIVGGGGLQHPAVSAACALGLSVWVSDRDPVCPCARLADRFFPLDIYDVEGHVALAQANRDDLAGVFTTACNATVTVAEAAAAAALPGIPPGLARVMADKTAFRQHLQDFGLSALQPEWVLAEAPQAARSFAERVGLPVIVKAAGGSGGRGHHIIHDMGAFDRALNSAPFPVFIEKYVAGIEVSAEAIWVDGQMAPLNAVLRLFAPRWPLDAAEVLVPGRAAGLPLPWTNRVLEAGFYTPVELGHVSPAPLSPDQYLGLWLAVESVGLALGYDRLDGGHILKCDLLLASPNILVLEATPRLSGNWDSGLSHRLAWGRDLTRLALSYAVGRPPHPSEFQPRQFQYAVVLNLFSPPGILESVSFPRDANVLRRFWKPVRIPAEMDGYASGIGAYAYGTGKSWPAAYLAACAEAAKVVFHVER